MKKIKEGFKKKKCALIALTKFKLRSLQVIKRMSKSIGHGKSLRRRKTVRSSPRISRSRRKLVRLSSPKKMNSSNNLSTS